MGWRTCSSCPINDPVKDTRQPHTRILPFLRLARELSLHTLNATITTRAATGASAAVGLGGAGMRHFPSAL